MEQQQFYQEIAKALNNDFRSVLHATATESGIVIAATCQLSVRHLAANIEFSRALSGKNLTVFVSDSGIICVR